DGAGNENGILMGNNSSLSGFEIKNARIGVYSEGIKNIITKCFIHDNQQSGIVVVGHLPLIIDNVIVENGGSGIQGWDVRSTIATINHNTIAFNSNNGISIGGNSDIVVENNICAFNEKLGLKVEPGVKVSLIRNNFFLNAEVFTSLPSNNFTFDPMFVSATTMNYMISENSKCRNMATDNKNIGARIVY
ncbi:MAG: right-handed parallel beta-helix repeat-containing protein, partial [Chitinispirillia bacterium]